jgi:hypothetical protein
VPRSWILIDNTNDASFLNLLLSVCAHFAPLQVQLLDANADAEITQQEFTEALVRIFLVRKSLSLTLMVRAVTATNCYYLQLLCV